MSSSIESGLQTLAGRPDSKFEVQLLYVYTFTPCFDFLYIICLCLPHNQFATELCILTLKHSSANRFCELSRYEHVLFYVAIRSISHYYH